MKATLYASIGVLLLASLIFSCGEKKTDPKELESLVNQLNESRVTLPNGWSLSPAGASLPLGDFPMNLVVSPSGKYMAVTNNGQSKQTITLIDPASEKIIDEVTIEKSWYG
jgi:hypothetical protein